MNTSLLNRQVTRRPDRVLLAGRILFLTEDPESIRRQLSGWDMPWDSRNPANNPRLRDDISTDEITPAHLSPTNHRGDRPASLDNGLFPSSPRGGKLTISTISTRQLH